ncbi:hypothetical protein [Polluticoccus soli]|uniref:hypothetical protein n=1 Tax=Polluticoccus soli TaxID=3034150 RepID=UPI0023E1F9D7|nr:hypothetical protein [Flavipsychrobacter sp. JY13-12]
MNNTPTQFALAIVFPGADNGDVVKAAIRHYVHVIDKEDFIADKDYAAQAASYQPYTNGSRIMLLFIFSEGNTVLADNETNLQRALLWIREMSN